MDEPAAQKPEEKPSAVNKALKVLAYPVAAFSGWYHGHTTVSNSLYDTLKHAKDFEDKIRHPHWKKVQDLTEGEGGRKLIDSLAAEHANYATKRTEYFRKKGFNNTLDYFRGISRHEQTKGIVAAFTAAGLALGVVLTLADNKSLQTLFSRKKQDSKSVEK